MPDLGTAAAAPVRGWGWTFVAGIVLFAGGIVAIFHPLVTGLATALLLGSALLAGGAFALLAGISDLRGRGGWLYAILGLSGLLAGLLVLFNPFAGALSLVWAIGVWLVAGGIFELFGGLSARRGRWWLILVALVDIALGVVLMFMDPFSALFLLAVAVGLSLAVRGIGLALYGLGLRRRSRR